MSYYLAQLQRQIEVMWGRATDFQSHAHTGVLTHRLQKNSVPSGKSQFFSGFPLGFFW